MMDNQTKPQALGTQPFCDWCCTKHPPDQHLIRQRRWEKRNPDKVKLDNRKRQALQQARQRAKASPALTSTTLTLTRTNGSNYEQPESN